MVRSSTKRMAIGRPATAPPMPLLNCSGVQRVYEPTTSANADRPVTLRAFSFFWVRRSEWTLFSPLVLC